MNMAQFLRKQMMRCKAVMLFSVLASLWSQAIVAADLDPRSQQIIRDWVRITDRRQDAAEEQLKTLYAQMNELKLTYCHFVSWKGEFEKLDSRNTGALNYLKSQVAEVEQTVDTLERLIDSYLNREGERSIAASAQIRELAVKVAANEESLASTTSSIERIMKEVLPTIRSEIERQQEDIPNELAVIRLAMKDYESQFRNFCDRLKDHEKRIAELENRRPIQQIVYDPNKTYPEPDAVFSPIPVQEKKRYSPDYIALKRSKICDNAQLLEREYVYRMKVDGYVKVYFGSIFKACDGRIVLVKEREPQILRSSR